MATHQQIVQHTVILRDTHDWEAWILIVKTLAGDSWRYINPTSTAVLEEPQKPQPTDFGGTNSSNIDPDQRVHWIEFSNLYYRELKEYERKKARIDKAEEHIITHTDPSLLLRKANYTTLRAFLTALKEALAPSEKVREQLVIDQYNEAKHLKGKSTNVEDWQQKYLLAYLRGKDLEIPDVMGDRPHWDLVKAFMQLDSAYAAVVSTQITSATLSNQPLPTVESIINQFTQHHRHTHTIEANIHGGVYATLNGEPPPYNTKDKKRPSRCPCGDFHLWGSCPELIESIRTTGFQLNSHKQENIKTFCKDPKRAILVQKVRLKARQYQLRQKKEQYRKNGTRESQEKQDNTEDDTSSFIEIDAGDEPS